MKQRFLAVLVTLLLPIASIVAIPSPAQAATYCYDIQAFDPSGFIQIYASGLVNQCVQPIDAEIHLREDISWSPDREVTADYRYGVTSAFMEVVANCVWFPGSSYYYFVETRVRVNGSYQQKKQSDRWHTSYRCG
jgi:hypothetical protein